MLRKSYPSLFITGTDTGVGKTLVAGALVAAFRQRGVDAVPMKPVQTGCEPFAGVLTVPDLEFVLGLANYQPDPAERRNMAPYTYEPACSPHLAAALAGSSISLETITQAYQGLEEAHDLVIMEGAGGLMVPLGNGTFMVDIPKKLKSPVLIVARPGLGTLNHCLLTLEVLRQYGLEPLGIVLVATTPSEPGLVEEDNRKTLPGMGHVPVYGPIPHLPDLARGAASTKAILAACKPALAPFVSSFARGA